MQIKIKPKMAEKLKWEFRKTLFEGFHELNVNG